MSSFGTGALDDTSGSVNGSEPDPVDEIDPPYHVNCSVLEMAYERQFLSSLVFSTSSVYKEEPGLRHKLSHLIDQLDAIMWTVRDALILCYEEQPYTISGKLDDWAWMVSVSVRVSPMAELLSLTETAGCTGRNMASVFR